MVHKWEVTITEVKRECIYNALGASLVGPLATCEHEGQRVSFIDSTGVKASIVQPMPDRYTLAPGQQPNRGHHAQHHLTVAVYLGTF
jgi:hypothetical protein